MDRYFFADEYDYIQRECERAQAQDDHADAAVALHTTGDEPWLVEEWAVLRSMARAVAA